MKTPALSLAATLCLLVLPAACPHLRADDDSTSTPPVWMGTPGVDIDQARARLHARYEAAMHWEIDQNLTAYEKVGKKDPRWDEAVRETLRHSSNFAQDQPGGPAAVAAQRAACARALDRGCDDPLIVYLGMRTGRVPAGASLDQLAQLYTAAERDVALSGYSPLRKFYAACRVAQQDMLCRRSSSGTVGQPDPGETEPAAGWAEGTDAKAAFQQGLTQLEALVADRNVSPMLYYDATKSFLELASSDPVGRAEVLEPLEKFFTSADPGAPASAVWKLIEGRFWTVYAWDARGSAGTNDMSDDNKKRFYGRMDKARASLEEAWKLDPTDSEIARNMITVSADQSSQWSEVDRWLRRAMDTKPNNYDAALAYLRFLQPSWGGSEEKMVEFGRRCFASQDALSRLPLILLDVRWRMATKFTDDEAAYWRRPEVWADMHQLYDFYTRAMPENPAFRTDYAIFAWRAGDWPVAHEQFELIGDKPDRNELHTYKYSLSQYQDMRREAADGVKTAR